MDRYRVLYGGGGGGGPASEKFTTGPVELGEQNTHTHKHTHTHTPPMSNTEQHPRAPSRLALTSLALDCDGRQHQLLSASLCEERGY